MIKQWYNKLGFSNYPLDPRSNPNLVGVENIENRLVSYILQGNMCLLCGHTGSGKTSMLKRLMLNKELKNFEFVYISADGIEKAKDIRSLINDKRSIITRLFKKMKNIVILLDECQVASRILTESIKSRWNEEYPDGQKVIQSVIISQIDSNLKSNFSGSFMDRLGKRVIRMRKLTGKELEEVLNIRLKSKKYNYIKKFDKTALKFLIRSCGGSVRQLLEYTDVIFRELDRLDEKSLINKRFKLKKDHVFTFLQKSGLVIDHGIDFKKIRRNKKHMKALEMFEQFGAMDSVLLAEKLDKTKRVAETIIRKLEKEGALIVSHTEDDKNFYVMTPRMKHEMVTE